MIKGTWQEANAQLSDYKLCAAWAALLGIIRRLDGRDVTDAWDPETPVEAAADSWEEAGQAAEAARACGGRDTVGYGFAPAAYRAAWFR